MFKIKPFLSIVCLFCDKDYQYISNLVKEIKSKIHVSYELILVDNREVNKDLIQFKEKNITIIKTGENLYQFMGRLRAIPYCNGKYTWFIDSDDHPLDIYNKDKNVVGDIICYNIFKNGKEDQYFKKNNHIMLSQNIDFTDFTNINCEIWDKWIKTECLIPYYNQYKDTELKDIFFEDGFLILNAIHNSNTIQFIDKNIYNYMYTSSCKDIKKLLIGYDGIKLLIKNLTFKNLDIEKYLDFTLSSYIIGVINTDTSTQKIQLEFFKNFCKDRNLDYTNLIKNFIKSFNIRLPNYIESSLLFSDSYNDNNVTVSVFIYLTDDNYDDVINYIKFLNTLKQSIEIFIIDSQSINNIKIKNFITINSNKFISLKDKNTIIKNYSTKKYIWIVNPKYFKLTSLDLNSIHTDVDIISINTYNDDYVLTCTCNKNMFDLFNGCFIYKKDFFYKLDNLSINNILILNNEFSAISIKLIKSDIVQNNLLIDNINKLKYLYIDNFKKNSDNQYRDNLNIFKIFLLSFISTFNNINKQNFFTKSQQRVLSQIGFDFNKQVSLSIICCFCDKDYQYISYIKNEIDKKVLLEHEVIWVDNRKKYKNIKLNCLKNENVINNKSLNKSQFYGRKLGAMKALKEYTWFIDPDDNLVDKINESNTKIIYNYDMIIIPKNINDSYNNANINSFFSMKKIKDPLLTIKQGLWNKWLKTDLLKKCFNDFPNKNISYRDDALILLQFIKYCNVCGTLYNGVFYNYNMEDSDSNKITFQSKSSYNRYMNGYKNALKVYNTVVNKGHDYNYDFANTKKLEKVYKNNKLLKKDKILKSTIIKQNNSVTLLNSVKHTKF